MKKYGLLGFPLSHSFSKKYFTDKFIELGIADDHKYDLIEIENLKDFRKYIADNKELAGLNVTIPHKIDIMQYLDEIDPVAEKIGAINVIKFMPNGKLKGYNSDYYGFQKSLLEFIGSKPIKKALILGFGGASKAVLQVLLDNGIETQIASRRKGEGTIGYFEANKNLSSYDLIVNGTPLGTYPKTNEFPDIDYEMLSEKQFLFDLVYNPSETLFMRKGKEAGANVKNGYDMLVYQAEKAWEHFDSAQ